MALVNVVNMVVLDNPCNFQNPFQFEITFECLQELQDDLEWKVLYVGSAHDATKDQVLDEILVGPVPVGINKFCLQADAPTVDDLPEVLGVTVVLVTCCYKEREFCRVGYYVNNELVGHDVERDGPPPSPLPLDRVQRQILADKPRVTKFPIAWDDSGTAAAVAAEHGTTHGNDAAMMEEEEHDTEKYHHSNPPAAPTLPENTTMEAKMAAAMERGTAAAAAMTPPTDVSVMDMD
mmetsp:Transcript_4263/g.11627  ORF Transcript_4263/g.11627 Transcript_4263/m.11627 type:complete len:235 (+) Transcript_4263:338-1042(+)|eukprot:CAMPEP_0168737952 /NCGR_PEP_ID=MMETSP0724-20121128/10672_1 /TAXON_ID=265536 /ORGANISM="Amphiprora sp., Strain CCMP467" /LENGTH=234 /DNA_ID=CAMNT_0008785259 /DNA_START=334 /DNA_END=1038 /DNA_ORIENTATION=+